MQKNKVIKNVSWIIGCKVIQSLISLVIGMLSARYLGPSNFGLISYAASIIAFVIPIMQLGLRSTLVQEFISAPENEGNILGTSLIMNISSGILSIIGVITFVSIVNCGEQDTILVCSLYSISILFQATEMIQYWFQSKLLSKYPSIAVLIAYIIVSIYKIYLLVNEKNIYWFTFSHVIDHFIISLILLIIYKKMRNQKISFSFNLAREMLKKSKYYIVSGMMVTIFQQTDHIMLKLMLSEKETGYYSAALTCVGVTSFVFFAIIDSARPEILGSKKISQEKFEKNIIGLYTIITYLALFQSIGMTVLAKPIIMFLYGAEYAPAIKALSLVVWYITFSYWGSVRNIWILAEGKEKYLWIINLSGAVLNVILNYCLIPIWGVLGASFASLMTQIFANVIVGFIIPRIRYNNLLMIKGLNPIGLINETKRILKMRK